MPTLGRSIIAGTPTSRTSAQSMFSFHAVNPATGTDLPEVFECASIDDVAQACAAAQAAAPDYQKFTPDDRAAFLELCADNILRAGDAILERAAIETGLSVTPRLAGERDRTVFTLRMFADLVREDDWARPLLDGADPDRKPIPKPDLRTMLMPLGPVAVFGSSNFPLAYSTAGTDTSSALAAGCPVIVKGHPAHPGTGELVAHCIADAARQAGMPPGVFSFLHAGGGGAREMAVGRELVQNRSIRAVGFTGSLRGGMALAEFGAGRTFDGRRDPIPVFSEMGSVNPVFIMPDALEERGAEIAAKLATSFTGSAGQLCTCPGLVIIARTASSDAFIAALSELTAMAGPMTMLSHRIREAFHERAVELAGTRGVALAARSVLPRHPAPDPNAPGIGSLPDRAAAETVAMLFRTDIDTFLSQRVTQEECFGPSTMIVECESVERFAEAARAVQGSLTGSIFLSGKGGVSERDAVAALPVIEALTRVAGRIVFDGVPTGVEVSAAMVHGGPYPASNQPHSTAVGARAIERWCRPVCFQNCPPKFLPAALR